MKSDPMIWLSCIYDLLHLVAAGLAEPERIRVIIRHLPSREFEGIGLTSEGSVAVKNLDQQMAPRLRLSDPARGSP